MIVQIPGTALRIERDALMHEMENDKTIRHLMQNYVFFGLSELARRIACIRLHHIEQRCCHWLLIAHDNALSDEFPLTHEFLAMMLGYAHSRRPPIICHTRSITRQMTTSASKATILSAFTRSGLISISLISG